MRSLCGGVAFLGDQGITQLRTIKAYVKGLQSYHVLLPSRVRNVWSLNRQANHRWNRKRTGRGERGCAVARKRLPITKAVLLQPLLTLDVPISEGVNLHAPYYHAFAGFLRMGEFTCSTSQRASPELSQWHLTRWQRELLWSGTSLENPSFQDRPFPQWGSNHDRSMHWYSLSGSSPSPPICNWEESQKCSTIRMSMARPIETGWSFGCVHRSKLGLEGNLRFIHSGGELPHRRG